MIIQEDFSTHGLAYFLHGLEYSLLKDVHIAYRAILLVKNQADSLTQTFSLL